MKLYCEACQRLGAPGSWSVIDGVLLVACGSCGAEAAHVSPRPSEAHDIDRALATLAAPTKGRQLDRQVSANAVAPTPADRWQIAGASPAGPSIAEQETNAALDLATGEESIDDDPWLEIGWARLQQEWADPAAHRRLLAEAAARGDFAGLGSRYRDHLAKIPDDSLALEARETLLKKATAQMFTQLPMESGGIGPAQAKSLRNVLLLLFLVGVIGFGGWVLLQMGGGM